MSPPGSAARDRPCRCRQPRAAPAARKLAPPEPPPGKFWPKLSSFSAAPRRTNRSQASRNFPSGPSIGARHRRPEPADRDGAMQRSPPARETASSALHRRTLRRWAAFVGINCSPAIPNSFAERDGERQVRDEAIGAMPPAAPTARCVDASACRDAAQPAAGSSSSNRTAAILAEGDHHELQAAASPAIPPPITAIRRGWLGVSLMGSRLYQRTHAATILHIARTVSSQDATGQSEARGWRAGGERWHSWQTALGECLSC